MQTGVPAGYKPFQQAGGFADHTGPIYYRKRGENDFAYGFRAEDHHLNPYGVVHGGMLFSFADLFLGRIVVAATKRACTTIKLNAEYVAPGKAGDWVEGEGEILRLTRDLAYMRAQVSANGATLMTAQGIWRLLKPY